MSELPRRPLPQAPDKRRFIQAIPEPVGRPPMPSPERFIPREQLGRVKPWTMQELSGGAGGRTIPGLTGRAPSETAAQWQARVDKARDDGLTEGRRQGYEQGYRDGMAALEAFKQRHAQELGERFAALAGSLSRQLEELEDQAAHAVGATAVRLARQVVRQQLDEQPSMVAGVAREAVNAVLMSATRIVVRIHPDDHELVATGAAEALQARGARLLPDPAITRGGCRIESDVGAVDATLEARWARASASLGHPMPLEAPPTDIGRDGSGESDPQGMS